MQENKTEQFDDLSSILSSFDFTDKDLEELYFSQPKEEKSHDVRVAIYGNLLYRALIEKGSYSEDENLKKNNIKYIHDAFRFLNIGKQIKELNPKIKINKEELNLKHPLYANLIFTYLLDEYESLSRDKKISYYIAMEAALGYQENWNGSGIPEGKKAINISIYARICRIACDYDIFVTVDKMSHADAIKKLTRGKGTKYDPVIVDVFRDIERKVLDVKNYLVEEKVDEEVNYDKKISVFSDEFISSILLGKKGRIRNGMLFNQSLFDVDELRPIELLFTRIIDIDTQNVPFIEGHVIINSENEGTLFPKNYRVLASKSDRIEKLNKWALTEVSTIHESWELKFQRDVRFLIFLSTNILALKESVSELVNYLTMINVDKYKVAFEIDIDELIQRDSYSKNQINESIKFLRDTYGFEFVLNGVNIHHPSYDILMDFDFDYLKVDYRLYRGYSNRQKVSSLIEKLSDLCRDLGTRIIFTNIREKGEAKLINDCGNTLMTGPYFGELMRKPLNTTFKVSILD